MFNPHIIREHPIDGKWFYASAWKVPDLHFENRDSEADYFLHGFGFVEETAQPATNNMPVEEFINGVKDATKQL